MQSANYTNDAGRVIGDEQRFTGSQINYYFICKRKLWLFSHNIELEPESDLVKLGKLLHENRYQRKMKEVQVDRIKVDFMETKRLSKEGEIETTTSGLVNSTPYSQDSVPSPVPIENLPRNPMLDVTAETLESREQSLQNQQREIVIHEVKRSKKLQDAHLFQLLYYMYYLKTNYGVNISRGVLHYPLLKQNVDVSLTKDRITQIQETLKGITEINSLSGPPQAEWKRYCRSCAYQDLCWG